MVRKSILVSALALAGCAAGPGYKTASSVALKVPDAYVSAPQGSAQQQDISTWWAAFDDPVLTDLVDRALRANPSIDVAGARLRQARASARQANASFFPSISASGSANHSEAVSGEGMAQTGYRAGFDASYEVDLFGAVRRNSQAARASAAASLASLHNSQRTIAAEVVVNYVQLRAAQARLAVARSNLAFQTETRDIVRWRTEAGLSSALDLEQAETQLAQTSAGIPSLETSLNAAANRLATLLGEAPGALREMEAKDGAIPIVDDQVSAGVPADLLRQRPDLVAAERALAGAVARIGVAKAALFPALRLSGSITGSSASIGGVTDTLIGSAVASLIAPIFQAGRLHADVIKARAEADAALATYRAAVLAALEESENALTGLDKTRIREERLAKAETSAQAAATYARAQFRAGQIDFQKLLESERSLLTAQDTHAAARAERALAAVQLYKALGGGWQKAPMPRTVTKSLARN